MLVLFRNFTFEAVQEEEMYSPNTDNYVEFDNDVLLSDVQLTDREIITPLNNQPEESEKNDNNDTLDEDSSVSVWHSKNIIKLYCSE